MESQLQQLIHFNFKNHLRIMLILEATGYRVKKMQFQMQDTLLQVVHRCPQNPQSHTDYGHWSWLPSVTSCNYFLD